MTNTVLKNETALTLNHEIAPWGAPEDFDLTGNVDQFIDAEFIVTEAEQEEKSHSKELVAANDNMFPTFPTDPTQLPKFITVANKAVDAERLLLKTLIMNPQKYQIALKLTQKHAILLLQAQLRVAESLRAIKVQRGLRTDLKTKANRIIKSKKEIIAQDYNLTVKQAREIERLTQECVDLAIQEALENNDIPTRALAISKLGKKAKEERGVR